MISFSALTQQAYDALDTKVTDRLYFLTDTGILYLNGVRYGTDVPVTIDWDESDSSSPAYIANKPHIPVDPVQADWDESDSTALDFIKGKATVTTPLANLADALTFKNN